MGREGADKITKGGFYVAVVLTVLLFGSKTLVLFVLVLGTNVVIH